MAEFFHQNIEVVFFFYGLSFFLMGFAILLELGRSGGSGYAQALRPLAGFGIVHGSHEWFEMAVLLHKRITGEAAGGWEHYLRIILLMASFMMLVVFGQRLIIGQSRPRVRVLLILSVFLLWVIGLVMIFVTMPVSTDQFLAADVYTRYSLAIPGAALSTWGLFVQRKRFYQAGMERFGRDVVVAAVALGLYGAIGQLFASPSALFPSKYINAEIFLHLFGFPVQLFRAVMACITAVFIVRSLRSFDEDTRRRIETLREANLAERQRLEALRGEMLHCTIQTQEAERQRIARELHDETGQTLTALALGLHGLGDMVLVNELKAVTQAQQLEKLATAGIEELQRVVSGLRPPQLDELGLPAALRWYGNEAQKHSGVTVHVQITGGPTRLHPDIAVTLFRITQEAVTNAIRHGKVKEITVSAECSADQVSITIEDKGVGFDVEKTLKGQHRQCWGLLGMKERAALIGGSCEIHSVPNQGTRIRVEKALNGGKENGGDQNYPGR